MANRQLVSGSGSSSNRATLQPSTRSQTISTAAPTSSTYTVRRGDYVYTYRNGVQVGVQYSPSGRQGSPGSGNSSSLGATSTRSTAPTYTPTYSTNRSTSTGTLTSGGNTLPPTVPQIMGQYSSGPSGTGSAAGSSFAGSPSSGAMTTAGSAAGPREPYGYTKDLSLQDVNTAVYENPLRILGQVMGQNALLNPGFAGFMTPYVDAAANPFVQMLSYPGLGGAQNPLTTDDTYNFIANMIKASTTPGGGGGIDIGAALQAIQSGLGNAQSPLLAALTNVGGATGSDAYKSQIDNLMSAIGAVLQLNASPVTQILMSSQLDNARTNFLNTFNPNQPTQALEYMMQALGLPVSMASPAPPIS